MGLIDDLIIIYKKDEARRNKLQQTIVLLALVLLVFLGSTLVLKAVETIWKLRISVDFRDK